MQKAQGALEYLLLIGGAVLVAVIVITLLLGIANQGQTDTQATTDSALSLIEQKRAELIDGTGGGTGGTQTTVIAMLTGSKSATAANCIISGNFCTRTDYSISRTDYGGVLSFTVPSPIPTSATINSATLALYQYTNIAATCINSDPIYVYTNSSFTCEQSYTSGDNSEPTGWEVSVTPDPASCVLGYKSFEIAGAIPTGTANIYLEFKGGDIDGLGYNNYRCWRGFGNTNPPTLEIIYTV